jgi:hypothetical protein
MIILSANVLNFNAAAVARRTAHALEINQREVAGHVVGRYSGSAFYFKTQVGVLPRCTKMPYKKYFKICGRRCAPDGMTLYRIILVALFLVNILRHGVLPSVDQLCARA